jgi:hypothetical protein
MAQDSSQPPSSRAHSKRGVLSMDANNITEDDEDLFKLSQFLTKRN